MKCVIVYFSQTGNTEKIAQAIRVGVETAADHCDILPIKDANPGRLHDHDLIGIGSPVWGAEPNNVQTFINNMRSVGGKHAFAFCTHGGVPDHFYPGIIARLKRRGLVVIGARDWYGDCSMYHHCYPYPTAGHPDEIDLKEAEEFGKTTVDRSRRVSRGDKGPIIPTPPKMPPPSAVEMEGFKIIKAFPTMVKFHADRCSYPECRLCMDNCPMCGIDLSVEPPVIAKPCANCEFCARICPTGAIDIGDWLDALQVGVPMMKNVILPRLAKDEEEGRFRRLLPLKNVGYTLNYRLRTKHPQWIIGKGYGETL